MVYFMLSETLRHNGEELLMHMETLNTVISTLAKAQFRWPRYEGALYTALRGGTCNMWLLHVSTPFVLPKKYSLQGVLAMI